MDLLVRRRPEEKFDFQNLTTIRNGLNLSFWGFDVLNYCFDVSIKKPPRFDPPPPTLFLRNEADQEGGGAKKFQGGALSFTCSVKAPMPDSSSPG